MPVPVGASTGGLAHALFGPGVVLATHDPRAPATGLYPEEARAVGGAVERRRREFAAGRRCAREALAALGRPAVPIPAGADRAPVWPCGVVGSITHTARWCGAAVAPHGLHRGLGLDAEPPRPLPADVWDEVLTQPERTWVAGQPLEDQGLWARLLFCAKEAAYKCQYPLTARMLSFDEVRIVPAPNGGRFWAEVPWGGEYLRMPGRYLRTPALLLAAVVIPGGGAPR
jgi:4'-phosphopantetheinyl transferase EntD